MVSVDQELCTGCGVCIEMCPEVFVWGSEGKVTAIKQSSEGSSMEEVADACPTEAINV
ncbi:MAG: ferredoxin [bacterium]